MQLIINLFLFASCFSSDSTIVSNRSLGYINYDSLEYGSVLTYRFTGCDRILSDSLFDSSIIYETVAIEDSTLIHQPFLNGNQIEEGLLVMEDWQELQRVKSIECVGRLNTKDNINSYVLIIHSAHEYVNEGQELVLINKNSDSITSMVQLSQQFDFFGEGYDNKTLYTNGVFIVLNKVPIEETPLIYSLFRINASGHVELIEGDEAYKYLEELGVGINQEKK